MVDGTAGELVIAGFRSRKLAMNATFEETVTSSGMERCGWG